MFEGARIIALGSAYVEGKIQSVGLHLPEDRNQLPAFLDNHPEADLYAGGSIPNILTSFVRLSGNPRVRLLSCVGNDARGNFYRDSIHEALGKPQVTQQNPTDIWVGIYNNGLVEGIDSFGAMSDLIVSQEELQALKNEVLITDVDVCKLPRVPEQIKKALDVLEDNGLFALSLVGSSPHEDIQQVLSFAKRDPDLVFGNTRELLFISGETDIDKAIKTIFPSSRLLVITQAERGAKVRWHGEVFDIPAGVIPQEQVIDETGAGDSYMGTMLALLLPLNYRDWRENHIINAANVASYAAALVIQSMHSRLTPSMARLVQNYKSNL